MSDGDTQNHGDGDTSGHDGGDGGDQGNWYDKLGPDLANNPTLQKYKSAEEAHKGHLELQKTLGSDRVPWPKDANDQAAWAEVNKRLGVPEKSDGYNLAHVKAPEGVGVEHFDRFAFQEKMHANNVRPETATALWKEHTDMLSASVAAAQEQFKTEVNNAKAKMQEQWGEAYETKIQRGQQVIDNFSNDQKQADIITASLAKDPNGMEFLAKIGDLMAESSIGGFQDKQSFTMTPKEARMELDKIMASPEYQSDNEKIRGPLVERTLELRAMTNPQAAIRPSGF